MTVALTFTTPLLLIGALAAAVPFVLHLLASVRAQEVFFPTLRFLKMSMEKTARRRRIQHWALLLVRSVLLALLALAVAEPVSRATGGWLTGRRTAAAIVLDNSYSMAVKSQTSSRFSKAQTELNALLGGDDQPALAAVLTTNGGTVSRKLTARLGPLRDAVAKVSVGYGRAPISQRVAAAIKLLQNESIPQRSVYILSDLQRNSFEELASLRALAQAQDIHILIVNTADETVENVGISDLEITGKRIVDEVLQFTATLVNSSPTDRVVDVALRTGAGGVVQRLRKSLRAAGHEGSSATVRFRHRFNRIGPASGEVFLDLNDDLAVDNIRRFSLNIGRRIKALVVRGQASTTDAPTFDPAMMLRVALQPYVDASNPWPISPQTIEAKQLAAAELHEMDVLFLAEVSDFTEKQARAIETFVRDGGTVVFFLGPGLQIDNYNNQLGQKSDADGGLLPGKLLECVGEVGPDADAVAVDWVDIRHPYFEGFYENLSDYLTVLVQRYVRLAAPARVGRVLVRLANGDPLVTVKNFGTGRVVLCTTTASPKWSNLPTTGLFLPMAVRISVLARQELTDDNMYLPGSQVVIKPDGLNEPPAGAVVSVTLPGADGNSQPVPVALKKTREGDLAVFSDTARLGTYSWKVVAPGMGPGESFGSGSFVVNPSGPESCLESIPAGRFIDALHRSGVKRVYVGSTLGEVRAAAKTASQGRNWWDLILSVVIILLVVEAVVANRFRGRRGDVVESHLNPRLAR
ncbi:MAG: BatA domain-containing protein [Planctomycetota bacterium]|nr:BatA domain-containing protein [Planctomycetota bacterium]